MSTKFLFGLNMAGDRQSAQPEAPVDVQRGVSERMHTGYQASVNAEQALELQLYPKPAKPYSAEKLFQPKWAPAVVPEDSAQLPSQTEQAVQTVNENVPVLDTPAALENMPAYTPPQRGAEEEINRQEHIDRVQAELAKIREEQQ